MIDTIMLVKKKLEEVREMVQQTRVTTERARVHGSRKPYDDEDMAMYGDGMKQPYTLNEVKKRRGVSPPFTPPFIRSDFSSIFHADEIAASRPPGPMP